VHRLTIYARASKRQARAVKSVVPIVAQITVL